MTRPVSLCRFSSAAFLAFPSTFMAAVLSLMLWNLAMLIQDVGSSTCRVACSTDYNVLINCSCASVPAQPLRLDVNCSDGEHHVADSCQVTPPQSWCAMYPPELFLIAAVGTECTATVGPRGGPDSELSSWALYDAVKPPPPFNVRVTSADEFYNITWELANHDDDCLTYRLRIRTSPGGLLQDASRSFSVDEQFLLVDHKELPPRAKCSVAVRAKLCPSNPSQGPWSEWSSVVKWTNTPAESADVAVKGFWLYILLAVLFAVAGLLLAYSRKPFLLKRFQLSTYVSGPHDFFKPLYRDYGGNFKEWVKPVFSEHDLLGNTSHVEETTNKKQQFRFHVPTPLAQLGHVSIHTVIVCGGGEDGLDALGPYGEPPLADSDLEEVEAGEGRDEDDWPQEAEERASLASNRPSDDGYPRVDLDTVDSGFGECASPAHSGSRETAGDLLAESLTSHSNYVKQWMMAGEESRNVLQ
ncbi:interleukin-21 receptor-like isoform X2 [Festucalex cinctus]